MHSAKLASLAGAGFDIAHAFDAAAITRGSAELTAHDRSSSGARGSVLTGDRSSAGTGVDGLGVLAGPERCGILIGNTRALWPRFTAAMRDDPALAAERDPLERYTERTIAEAFPAARIFYSHRRYADGAFLPFQRLAVSVGLGALSEGGLVIHPTYGPWFALRAIVLVDGEPVARAQIAQPCTCVAQCREALSTALATRGPDEWRAWLAVRDACSLRAWRYTDDQIRYHYLKVF